MLNKPYSIIFVAVNVLLLSACTQPAENPKVIAEKYWQNLQTGNVSEAEKLTSLNSRLAFAQHRNFIDRNTQVSNNDVKTIVNTSITKFDSQNNKTYTENIETVLVLEQGRWKVDAEQSQLPPPTVARKEQLQQLAEELSESMQENIDSIDESMDQGMEMLNNALQEGSNEMSQSLLNLMNELNNTMQKSIDKMKQRRQQHDKEQNNHPTQTKPDPRQGEGMI